MIAFTVTAAFAASSAGWGLVLLHDAAQRSGAVCLDGSPGGYYFQKGTGNGSSGWMIHLQGGGWCVNEDDCRDRSKSFLGSSNGYADDMNKTLASWDCEAKQLKSTTILDIND